METGAITPYIDVAQIVLYLFWAFFAGLIYYLLRENHREGYPMDSGRENGPHIEGWPPVPEPKTFKTQDGHTYLSPIWPGPTASTAPNRHTAGTVRPWNLWATRCWRVSDPAPGPCAQMCPIWTCTDIPKLCPCAWHRTMQYLAKMWTPGACLSGVLTMKSPGQFASCGSTGWK